MGTKIENAPFHPLEEDDIKIALGLDRGVSAAPDLKDSPGSFATVKQEESTSATTGDSVEIKTEPACNDSEQKLSIHSEEIMIKEEDSAAEMKFVVNSAILPMDEVAFETETMNEVSNDKNESDSNIKGELYVIRTVAKNQRVCYKCSLCSYSNFKLKLIRQHVNSHCGFSTNYKKTMTIHHIVHRQRQGKMFECNQCDYKGSNNLHLMRHKLNHMNDKPFKCNLCNYSSIYSNHLKQHIICHNQEKPFKCSICSYRTKRKTNLKEHIATHMQVKLLKCDKCDFRASKKSYMERHKVRHTIERPLKCGFCDYHGKSNIHLNIHLKLHSKEKPFKCSSCDFSTHRKKSLNIHILTHSTERTFECNECSYICKTANALYTHKNLHTGKNYICESCNYMTYNRGTIIEHLKAHASSKQNPFELPSSSRHYRCDKCSFANKDINLLVKHMKTHFV